MKDYTKWLHETPLEECGILVALDASMQWLLPWWYAHVIKLNTLPITFIDLGLKENAKQWCRQRGTLITLDLSEELLIERLPPLGPFKLEEEKNLALQLRNSQKAWFKKPFALLMTPYKKTVFLDVDCQVKCSLTPLLSLADNPLGLALTSIGPNNYNSGVIPYLHKSPMISKWAEATLFFKGFYRGDQDILTAVLNSGQVEVTPLPKVYNWRVNTLDLNEEAAILHFTGPSKEYIREEIRSNPLFTELNQ